MKLFAKASKERRLFEKRQHPKTFIVFYQWLVFKQSLRNGLDDTPQVHAPGTAQPLPRMSVSNRVNPHIMVFGHVTTSNRLPLGTAFHNQYDSPWNGGAYQTANAPLHDEYSCRVPVPP
ncbi:TonB-dependent receptor [Komagataeibacter xylinus E25]|nr:TonB-dependent receptor [Komagataeibacter xylinus E25]